MKNLLILLTISFCLMNSCSSQWGRFQEIKGNGNTKTEERDLNKFDGIKACCSMEVLVNQGSNYAVSVEADDNLLQYIVTEVSEGQLTIKQKDNVSLAPKERIKIYVTLPQITELRSSSSSDIICSGSFKGKELKLDVSSSGNIQLDFRGESVRIESSSSGKIGLSGSADRLRFEGSSSSKVDARNFTAGAVRAEASSSARLAIKVTDELDAEVSSSGRVEYWGSPEKLSTDTNSSGKVSKQD